MLRTRPSRQDPQNDSGPGTLEDVSESNRNITPPITYTMLGGSTARYGK